MLIINDFGPGRLVGTIYFVDKPIFVAIPTGIYSARVEKSLKKSNLLLAKSDRFLTFAVPKFGSKI